MAVQDVNVPPKVKEVDVKDVKPKSQESSEYWAKQVEAKRARREALEEDKAIQNLEHPAPPPESPFEVKGKFDLGTFNLQEREEKTREDAERARKEYADKEKELQSKLDLSQKELTENKLTAALKEIGNQFNSTIKEMNAKIDSVAKGADPSNLTAYIDSLEKLAIKMGFQRGEAGPAVGDPHLAIELQKMKAEEAARERTWQLELKKFDYEMKRQFRNDEADIAIKKEELEAKKKKDEMFAKAPELIGRAIAHGMMEEGGTAPIMSQKTKGKGYQVTAIKGESGEVDCPKCNQPIVIGPTAKRAVCAGCGLSVSVARQEPAPSPKQPVEEESEEIEIE